VAWAHIATWEATFIVMVTGLGKNACRFSLVDQNYSQVSCNTDRYG
jgi:hypothetical protein